MEGLGLDPEADARLSASLDARSLRNAPHPTARARTFDQLRADAFVTAVTAPRAGASTRTAASRRTFGAGRNPTHF